MPGPPSQPIDAVSCAESLITLLDHLDLDRLPEEERAAVAKVQTEALENWLTASPLPFAGDESSFSFEQPTLPGMEPGTGSGTPVRPLDPDGGRQAGKPGALKLVK